MSDTVQSVPAGEIPAATIPVGEVLARAAAITANNGLRYATFGTLDSEGITVSGDLPRLAGTIPAVMTPALETTVFYFVPLVISPERGSSERGVSSTPVTIASVWSPDLADNAVCHRNVHLSGHDGVLISARLQGDQFALAFELFLNAAHAFVDATGVPEAFSSLLASQLSANTRGETSHDAWEYRQKLTETPADEKARTDFYETAYVDSLAIYLLSMFLDLDYADLREREYPLVAPAALAERLRCVHKLFPPNPGYTFEIRYRRR